MNRKLHLPPQRVVFRHKSVELQLTIFYSRNENPAGLCAPANTPAEPSEAAVSVDLTVPTGRNLSV
jgi:hypothetical protein